MADNGYDTIWYNLFALCINSVLFVLVASPHSFFYNNLPLEDIVVNASMFLSNGNGH
uniref:Uncharacterized protein n=1 Tax=Arundo donax TaxID=35708 RepID=A0A0A9F0E6_ARUDO